MPAMFVLHAVAVTMLSVMKPSQDAPPTTTSGESSYGYHWEWSYATTGVTQYSHFYAYAVKYWNSCLANEVHEMSMWDKLHKLYQHFETVIPGFALLLNFWGGYPFRAVFLKFFDQSGLKLLAMKLFLRLTIFCLQLFEKIMYLLRG